MAPKVAIFEPKNGSFKKIKLEALIVTTPAAQRRISDVRTTESPPRPSPWAPRSVSSWTSRLTPRPICPRVADPLMQMDTPPPTQPLPRALPFSTSSARSVAHVKSLYIFLTVLMRADECSYNGNDSILSHSLKQTLANRTPRKERKSYFHQECCCFRFLTALHCF